MTRIAGPGLLGLLVTLLGSGCFTNGEWIPTVWGGAAIDDAEDPDGAWETDDGCTVELDAFVVAILGGALLTPVGSASAVLPGDQLVDLVPPGPHSLAGILMRGGAYPEFVAVVGPADGEATVDDLVGRGQLIGWDNAASDANPIRGNVDPADRAAMEEAGAAVAARGRVTCGTDVVDFDLLVPGRTGFFRCPNGDFELPGGSFGVTGLEARPEGLLLEGQPLVAADDGDGVLDSAELGEPALEALADQHEETVWFGDGGPCTWEVGEE